MMDRVGHIVVIEDEPGIVDFIERGLGARGLDVRSALDGDTGLNWRSRTTSTSSCST